MARSVPVSVAAYNDRMVEAIAGPIGTFFRPGDEVDLVSGNGANPLSIADVNGWQERLTGSLPAGTTFSVHTSGLDHAAEAAARAAPPLRSVLLDYEPRYGPEFTWEFRSTLSHLDRFAAKCRRERRRAVAYPSGRPLLEPRRAPRAWDYAEMGRRVDDVYPQTQHWASLGARWWAAAVSRLRSQHAGHGLDPRSIVVQLTIGGTRNGIRWESALARYREVERGGLRRLFLWWSPPYGDDLARFLAALEV